MEHRRVLRRRHRRTKSVLRDHDRAIAALEKGLETSSTLAFAFVDPGWVLFAPIPASSNCSAAPASVPDALDRGPANFQLVATSSTQFRASTSRNHADIEA